MAPRLIYHLETYPKITYSKMSDPPKRGVLGGGKGMNIFFNFRPMVMIQNENLLYKDQRIYFQHHHIRERALSRVKKLIKLSFFQKRHFSTIFK